MGNTVVKLSRRYEVPGEVPFDSVALREPTYREIFMDGLGRPFEYQMASNGETVRIVFPDAIDKYLQKLVVAPEYPSIYRLGAADAMKLQWAVCDFFHEPTDTKRSATSSSSDSGGTPSA